jgi:hypothetical protein
MGMIALFLFTGQGRREKTEDDLRAHAREYLAEKGLQALGRGRPYEGSGRSNWPEAGPSEHVGGFYGPCTRGRFGHFLARRRAHVARLRERKLTPSGHVDDDPGSAAIDARRC